MLTAVTGIRREWTRVTGFFGTGIDFGNWNEFNIILLAIGFTNKRAELRKSAGLCRLGCYCDGSAARDELREPETGPSHLRKRRGYVHGVCGCLSPQTGFIVRIYFRARDSALIIFCTLG